MPVPAASGPATRMMGACGPVDMAHVRSPIDGSRMHSMAAMITGMADGSNPAITALAAIFSTVPTPDPGANNPTTSSPGRPQAATMASTLARTGGTNGNPSLQPRRMND